jgi:hypothetical protein
VPTPYNEVIRRKSPSCKEQEAIRAGLIDLALVFIFLGIVKIRRRGRT